MRAINEVVDADVILCQYERDSEIAGWQLAKARHHGFDHEAATRAKVSGSVFETGDLFVL